MNTKILGALVGIGVLVIGVALISNWTKTPEEVDSQKSEVQESKSEEPKIESSINAYMEYYKSLSEGDIKEVKKYLAKSMVEQLEQSGMEDGEILEMIKSLVPEEVEITNENIEGNSSTLTGKGIGDLGYMEGTIEMVKENDKWKLLKESWSQGTLQQLPKEKTDIAAVNIVFVQKGKDNADLKAIIENSGKIVVLQLSYNFSINGSEEYGSLPVYNFGPGEKFELDLSHAYSNYYNAHSPKKGSKLEMILILDPKNELKEFNEGNNKITKIFYLQD